MTEESKTHCTQVSLIALLSVGLLLIVRIMRSIKLFELKRNNECSYRKKKPRKDRKEVYVDQNCFGLDLETRTANDKFKYKRELCKLRMDRTC